jgi:hypothetical protein
MVSASWQQLVLLLQHLSFSDLKGNTVGPLGIPMLIRWWFDAAKAVLCSLLHARPCSQPVKRTMQ